MLIFSSSRFKDFLQHTSKEEREAKTALKKQLRNLDDLRKKERNRYSLYVIEQNMIRVRQSINDLKEKNTPAYEAATKRRSMWS
ncbi:hypothetical protein TRVA0_019S02102 [Trichomonascus vanleenenianus]|uniref:uncharacterized protein n=1 Tax=Trichomonascus vanleenenianus TaxID=2268995 RepID=UPI003ECB10F1